MVNSVSVTLNSFKLKPGDEVTIDPHRGKTIRTELPFPVLYEDDYLIVIDKPAGISTSSIDGSSDVTSIMKTFIRDKSKGTSSAFVVHRLDKEVSGILLFAKTEELSEIIRNNWEKTEKHYYALVEGSPGKHQGTIKSWLKDDDRQKVHSVGEKEHGKFAITHYKLIKPVGNNILLDIQTETGRKNQIRVHLSDIGCPIVGDRKYGASGQFIRRIRLHACSLSFVHPVLKKKILVESPMPDGFLTVKDGDEKYKKI